MDNAQKEYYLREQIKAIQKELGDSDSQENDKLKERIEASDMPDEVREKALKEFSRMTKMAPGMPEISLIRNYLDWLLELPWTTESKECCDLKNARAILDRDHYGMEKVKKRVLEYLAVRERTGNSEGTILCLVGPPGVGKTSIAVSLAEAMGKKYVRMSLGGVRDEAEIRGHRRTYVGAIPGRIIYTMKQAGTVNPLFLLDEIDKMSSDFKGDPASAMLEVLDREQNNAFRDHYIEVPYDLSKVTFVTTANTLDTIPQPLKDRMEIIELGSYTNIEKFHIAKEHLLPKQLKKHGLNPDDVKSAMPYSWR
ncbi:MAG: AAA family ATPase [Oscillospiraceae bacterium]|nr:MAG: AAA family ATPase [Oscillospiraceae bacterium]